MECGLTPGPKPRSLPLDQRRNRVSRTGDMLGAAWGTGDGGEGRGDDTGRAAPAQSSVSHGSRWVASQGPHDGHRPGPSLAPDPKGAREEPGPAVQTRPRTPGADAHPTRRGRRPAIGLVTRGCSAVTAPGHPPRGVRRRPGLRRPPAAPAPKLCRLSQGQPGKQGQPPCPQSSSRPAAPPGRPASLPGNDLGVHAKYWVTPGGSSIRSADVTVLRTSTGPSLPSKPRFFVWGDISLRKRSLNQRDAGCPVTAGNATKQPTFPKPLPTQNFPDC